MCGSKDLLSTEKRLNHALKGLSERQIIIDSEITLTIQNIGDFYMEGWKIARDIQNSGENVEKVLGTLHNLDLKTIGKFPKYARFVLLGLFTYTGPLGHSPAALEREFQPSENIRSNVVLMTIVFNTLLEAKRLKQLILDDEYLSIDKKKEKLGQILTAVNGVNEILQLTSKELGERSEEVQKKKAESLKELSTKCKKINFLSNLEMF